VIGSIYGLKKKLSTWSSKYFLKFPLCFHTIIDIEHQEK
jgi:hypothetical protein